MGRTNRELLEIIYVTISWFWVLKHVNVRNPSLPSEDSFVYLTSDWHILWVAGLTKLQHNRFDGAFIQRFLDKHVIKSELHDMTTECLTHLTCVIYSHWSGEPPVLGGEEASLGWHAPLSGGMARQQSRDRQRKIYCRRAKIYLSGRCKLQLEMCGLQCKFHWQVLQLTHLSPVN